MKQVRKTRFAENRPCEFSGELGKAVLNSLSAHVAIIDEEGIIVETNRAWREFAGGDGKIDSDAFLGMNYLAICDAAAGEGAQDAHAVADGIRSVIRHEITEFLYDYPCHSPTEQHWFYMRAIRMQAPGPAQVVVSHEEITQLKLAEEALKASKAAIEAQKQHLEETNIALKVLLKQRAEDKLEMEQKVLTNIKELVFPYIEKLKRAPIRAKDKTIVAIIESHLNDIISPLLQRLANINVLLTPQEMQVAALVKDGRSSKEISDILNVSETTVHFHRKNLREKFGIKNTTTNLRSYLMSMS
ncbi:MAG: helix-turn-helix transcriptional regulator [Desulfatitalea sp.]|nr:helix-turn-helix transcriptional regulator [Desulfatitalea sp.]NNK01495.1 helix-turn-helix transcriptional regulator [Desulfatitalea sp.]